MCDTLCLIGRDRTVFAKNSDRPVREAQVVESFGPRPRGVSVRAQYVDVPDAGAMPVLGSRPAWLWGFEHGVNERRVAMGNERVWTVDDARVAPRALIGMDLVRLALERAANADEAIDVATSLLERHGQGGSGEEEHDEPYFSSFLVADPRSAWVLETSARTWAARPVEDGASISNRVSLGRDWTRASSDVPPDADFGAWRDPTQPTGHADVRLAATGACVATSARAVSARDVVATLRHHGERPWGRPGAAADDVSPLPTRIEADGTGVTVCMHLRGYQATAASMVAELPRDEDEPVRAWVALGSPCVSVYVPVFPTATVPAELARTETWSRFAALRTRVEHDSDALAEVRARFAPVEAELWDAADDAVATGTEAALRRVVDGAWPLVDDALRALRV